jgi:hypothetical protein
MLAMGMPSRYFCRRLLHHEVTIPCCRVRQGEGKTYAQLFAVHAFATGVSSLPPGSALVKIQWSEHQDAKADELCQPQSATIKPDVLEICS